MNDLEPGPRKQTPKPKTIAEQIAEAEARQTADDRAERNRIHFHRHWQKFKKTKARIYGSVSKAEYDEISERAITQGRHRQLKDGTLQANVFEQLIAEARAYNAQTYLPSKTVEGLITKLRVQLRKIGTNLNQIAHQSNIFGQTAIDKTQINKQIREIDNVIIDFVRQPWRHDLETKDQDR
jgi:hypothetical protein